MMLFSEQFIEQNTDVIEYKGKKVSRFFSFDKKGSYNFKFSFISTSSLFTQAIILHLISFNGKIYYNGTEIEKPNNAFPQLVFDENNSPNQFELQIDLVDGNICLCNASDLLGNKKVWRSLCEGCAMVIEIKNENHLRFYCNDHENDDDFDDLIFDLEISERK